MIESGIMAPDDSGIESMPIIGSQQHMDAEFVDKKRIDLIFVQVNKHKSNMTFETFLKALIKIGEHKYPHLTSSEALQDLVVHHLIPLFQVIDIKVN